MSWYYVEAGQQRGPVTEADLENLVRAGTIQGETLIWQEGMSDWLPYRTVKQGAGVGRTPVALAVAPGGGGGADEVVCSECGRIFSKNDVIRHGESYVCATCKPIFLQKIKEGAKMGGTMDYAGFWIRWVAKIVDTLILVIPVIILITVFAIAFMPGMRTRANFFENPVRMNQTARGVETIGLLVQLAAQAVFYGIMVLYNAFFLGKYGATPGKMIFRLRVVTAEGDKVSYGRAFGRAFAEILTNMTCAIGYIIAGFDGEKRALHDHICRTRVVRK